MSTMKLSQMHKMTYNQDINNIIVWDSPSLHNNIFKTLKSGIQYYDVYFPLSSHLSEDIHYIPVIFNDCGQSSRHRKGSFFCCFGRVTSHDHLPCPVILPDTSGSRHHRFRVIPYPAHGCPDGQSEPVLYAWRKAVCEQIQIIIYVMSLPPPPPPLSLSLSLSISLSFIFSHSLSPSLSLSISFSLSLLAGF